MSSTRRAFLRVVALGGASIVTSCGRVTEVLLDADDGGSPVSEPDGGSVSPDAGGPPADAGAGVDGGAAVVSPEPWPSSTHFGFGIAVGDVTTSRALVSTRYEGSDPLRLMVWRMDGARFAERTAELEVTPGDGGFVQLDLDGLAPGSSYRYAFVEGAVTAPARSQLGRFRTAPPPGQQPELVFGASSCTSGGAAAPLLQASRRDDLAAFFLLGDTSYNDGADTLAQFRTAWARSLSREAYRELRASTALIATWDDHEVDNNFNPENTSVPKLTAARQAFFEALPIRRHEMAPNRLWRSFRFGDTAEVFVLDTRGERKPSTLATSQEMLSLNQQLWLQNGLVDSPCRFKLVLTSVPITDFGFSVFNTDAWRAYQRQRLEVLRFVEERGLRGVLWVSGDHHFASVGRVSPSGPGASALEVLAGPASQTANPAYRLLRPPRWDFADGANNYLSVRCLPATGEVRLAFHDGRGAVLFERSYAL